MSLRSGSGYCAGCSLSGLRLSEALALSWDEGAPISVCMAGKYPALRIQAEAQKNHRDAAAADRARVRGVPVGGTQRPSGMASCSASTAEPASP